ncbi:carbohydrate ABC transporter permease [Schaalia sp. ZJ405]|uniref:carbohydrate ABC transporter permease n=1 Tax=Schaalia sp. ZJ405 TaxID=2709403 RepID=UPI0018CAA0F6|nr:carbohydrate ABC transporter permease [Schaalia sp. ZJ405]
MSTRRTAEWHPSNDHIPRCVGSAFWWMIVLGFMLFFITPVLWLFQAPLKSDQQLVHEFWLNPGSWNALVTSWSNLMAYQDGIIWRWIGNSILYAGIAMIFAVITCLFAGYALAVMKFRGRKLILMITMIVMMMPNAVLVLPLYLEAKMLGTAGTPLSVILPLAMYPFGVNLVFIYYSTNLPRSILDSARIDGCTEWQVFRKIALPLGKPSIALVSFFSFTTSWNNYFLPFVMLPSTKSYPVTVGLNNLLTSTPAFNPTVGASGLSIFRPELALATVLAVVPVLVLFLFNQRALVAGMMAGANKE